MLAAVVAILAFAFYKALTGTDLGKTVVFLVRNALNSLIVGPLKSGVFRPKNEPKLTPTTQDCCKQSYLKHRKMALEEEWDTVVIGSGMGGLATASGLSRIEGQKVLVLEQHDIAGGCCHTFEDKGFEFDTGVHYIGEMNNPKHPLAFIMSWLTRGKPWQPMEDCFDEVSFGKDMAFDIPKGKRNLIDSIAKDFPKERANIEKFFNLCGLMGDCFSVGRMHLNFPRYSHFYVKNFARFFFKLLGMVFGEKRDLYKQWEIYSNKTVKQVAEEMTEDEKLRNVFLHPGGDYGCPPGETPFAIHGTVIAHYFHGASYPVGGPQELVRGMIPAIEECGGKVLVKAEVSEIVLNAENVACGVRLGGKFSDDIIYAKNVVSACGAFNTFCHLISEKNRDLIRKDYELFKEDPKKDSLKKASISESTGHIYLFIGFKGDSEELGVKAKNYWMYNEQCDTERILNEYTKDMDKPIPGIFASFSSAKDPSFKDKYPGKTTAVMLCEAYHPFFAEWDDEKVKHRSEEYKALKEKYAQRLFDVLFDRFPHLKDKVEYYDVGTPCTNRFYLGAKRGESYGLEHTVKRIQSDELSTFTPIEGLFLTGQDTMCCGLVAAMMAGVLTAGAVAGRFLIPSMVMESKAKGYVDSQTLHKSVKAG